MSYSEKARELYKSGCNCAQATLGAFCEAAGVPMEDAVKIAANFGAGIAYTHSVCGAVTGMCMAAGLLYGTPEVVTVEARKPLEEKTRSLLNAFQEANGSLICRELLQIGPDGQRPADAPPQKPFCAGLVTCAAGILESRLHEDGVL